MAYRMSDSKKMKRQDKKKGNKINVPNRLSLVRIAVVPIILLLLLFPYEQFEIIIPSFSFGFVTVSIIRALVFVIFLFACFTDWLDGFIARRFNMVTSLGKFIDPIADKLLTTTLFMVYAWQGIIPVVPVVLMIWRDIIVDGVRMICAESSVVIAAGVLGKLKTVVQMITIVLITINNLPFELINLPMSNVLLWFSAFISVFSGISYVYQARDIILSSK